jgi:DNA-binding transcriptional LysR family regulator
LRFLDSARGALARLLSEDAIDIALERPHSTFDWISSVEVFQVHFKVIAAPGNAEIGKAAVAANSPLPLDLFCDLAQAIRSVDGSMTGLTDTALAEIGRKRRVVLILPHFQAVARAVAISDLIAVVHEHSAAAARRELPLAVYDAPFEIKGGPARMYWHSRHDSDPAHQWMREQVLLTLEELDVLNERKLTPV